MRRHFFASVAVLASGFFAAAADGPKTTSSFFAPAPDAGAKLPAQGIYPAGRQLAFMGYSGVPDRDLPAGFSVAGPVYGDQEKYLQNCFAKHWPVVVQVPTGVRFVGKGVKPPTDFAEAEAAARALVARYAEHDEVVWWAVNPEELRPWKKNEMDYLARMAKAIRETDPKKRPVYLYNPNHRDAGSLAAIARQVDILGKGCYVNGVGKKHDRAWVRWSIEQEIGAGKAAEHPVTPILMPELSGNPAPEEVALIEPWVRHDVYLGMCSGAKGVLIWSLFPRKGVRETWKTWYDAYARCGKELGRERHLGEVFLFGEPRADLQVTPVDGSTTASVALGGAAEEGTTNDAEREVRKAAVPDFTVRDLAFGVRRYLFVVNSREAERKFSVAGWPAGTRFTNAFTGEVLPVDRARSITLPAWGVAGIVAEADGDNATR